MESEEGKTCYPLCVRVFVCLLKNIIPRNHSESSSKSVLFNFLAQSCPSFVYWRLALGVLLLTLSEVNTCFFRILENVRI